MFLDQYFERDRQAEDPPVTWILVCLAAAPNILWRILHFLAKLFHKLMSDDAKNYAFSYCWDWIRMLYWLFAKIFANFNWVVDYWNSKWVNKQVACDTILRTRLCMILPPPGDDILEECHWSAAAWTMAFSMLTHNLVFMLLQMADALINN